MGRRSAYTGWFGRLNLPQVNNDETEELRLEEFTSSRDFIQYKIVRYITRNVPVRYTTVNYVKYPVEWKKSTRSAVIFKTAKKINIERYCEIELLNLDIPDEFKWEILKRVDFTPSWHQKMLDIEEIEGWIAMHERAIASEIDIKKELQKVEMKHGIIIEDLRNRIMLLKLLPSSTASKTIRFLLIPLTLGLSLIGYVSKKKAIVNNKWKLKFEKEIADQITLKTKELEDATKTITIKNVEIANNNIKVEKEIELLEAKLEKTKNTNYKFICDDSGFIDLRKALVTITKFEAKGVYIIWNKTKEKYYVGQSKDVYKRLFTQHFNNNDVKNIIFAKDWYANDEFFFKIIELETKDELDATEKEYIEKYDSFKNGYNATGGNK